MIRHPAVSGTFYPSDKMELINMIDHLLDIVMVQDHGNPIGLICPHAGYIYSGVTAAFAFKYLRDREYDNVIIMAPSHFDRYDGITTWYGDGLETPLGVVEVSKDDKILNYGVERSKLGFGKEHSLEVELPFLQRVLKPGWKLIPLVMGYQVDRSIELGSNLLSEYVSDKNLIIISSDLSHYHPYEKAKQIDRHFLNYILQDKLDDLHQAHEHGLVEACGFGPVMSFLKLNFKSKVLDYRTSGDTAGDRNSVVGYTAMGAFWND